jgi:methylated-DNA-[protein]-cysteine S-methyltransferase
MLSFTTALGVCALEWDERGITRVHMPGSVAATAVRERQGTAALPLVREAVTLITRLLAGEPADLSAVPVSHGRGVGGFARQVYAVTRRVGPGQTTTYGEIAREIDPGAPPGAARAVGAALGANPTPIIVPCHRVLAADGSLHGFSAPGGIATKRRMLQIEGAAGFAQQHLFR